MSEYISTRGGGSRKNYEDVLLAGGAADGGIYTPAELPTYDTDQLRELNQIQQYPDFFVAIRSDFVGDSIIPHNQTQLAHRAYTEEKFPAIEDGNYVPVRHVSGNMYIQALSEGPTGAFKDMALQPVGQDMNHVLHRLGRHLRLVGATSSDTGSAAEAGLAGQKYPSLFMLSPLHGMYDFPRAQMAAFSDYDNIHNIAIDTTFDHLQKLVLGIKSEPGFEDIGAVNSINWARIASQIPYYFSGYLQTIRQREDKKIDDKIDFVVPSGNMGNALAAYFAKQMGLPIRKIVLATNENAVLDRLVQTDVYAPTAKAIGTSSPAQDITRANNWERIVDQLLISEHTGEHDHERVRDYVRILGEKGMVSFADIARPDISLKDAGFESGAVTHAERLEAIRWVFQETNGQDIIGSHTANAVAVARRYAAEGDNTPIVCMETDKHDKTREVVEEALGFRPEPSRPDFADIERHLDNPDAFVVLDDSMNALKKYISDHS